MRPALTDKQRRHRQATSKVMLAQVRHCPSCGRGQWPARFEIGDGTRGYQCRFCKHEWSAKK
jgi:formate dehydrogenase maturation protein FdhE